MVRHSDIEKAIGKKTLMSDVMEASIRKWDSALRGEPLTEESHGLTLGLANTVSERLASLSVMEMEFKSEGSPRADWIDARMQAVLEPRKIAQLSRAVGLGSAIWLPYQNGDRLGVDFVPATGFYPIEEDENGDLCDVAIVDTLVNDRRFYHRLTRMHLLRSIAGFSSREREIVEELDVELPDPNGYPCIIVTNEVFESGDRSTLGKRIPITTVYEWAEIQPITYLYGTDALPLGYYVNPVANSIDPGSVIGVSVFANAMSAMIQADKQYDRYDWEFTAGAMAIDTDDSYLSVTPQARLAMARTERLFTDKSGDKRLPQGRDRLFRGLMFNGADKDFYHVFAPELRSKEYRAGLQQYLKDVESHCFLAFGELSEVNNVEKTATEIMAAKQRMYQMVSLIQGALEQTLRQLVKALDYWAGVLKNTDSSIPAPGEIHLSFKWDDSILITRNEEMQIWLEEVAAGIRSKAEYRAHFYGEDLEKAQENVAAIYKETTEQEMIEEEE